MKIELARQIAARIWDDTEMEKFPMDVVLAEIIAQLISTIDIPYKVKFTDKESALLINLLTNIVNALINNKESKQHVRE